MAYPIILNGRTYTLTDFEGTNYVDGFPDALEDFVTQAGDIYNSTSASSVTIGTGSKSFTTADSDKPYQAGTPLRIADASAPETNFLDCIVTSYSGTALVVEAFGFAGSGSYSNWTINIGGAKTVDGILAINQGGTGATSASDFKDNLGLGSAAEEDDDRYAHRANNLSDLSDASSARQNLEVTISGLFVKADTQQVAWTKTGNGTAETSTAIKVEVNGGLVEIASSTSISMPTLTAGTDYAIWVAPDGTLEADASYTVAPTTNGRRVGGFHYAPGGNASFSLDAGDGGTTPQINEYSFHDLKWRPSVADPRGLTLVGDGSFWCGIYHLAGQHLSGAPHRHGVNPARDGNPPRLVDDSGNYPDAQPMNIFESLWYHGFRTPRVEDFQLLAFGTNEAASRGSDPGTTGLPGGSTDAQFTSHWGVIQSTGVIALWSNDSILSTSDETLPNPSRGDRFRVSRFAFLGGLWFVGSNSGSRYVDTVTATGSVTDGGGRGVCDHLILD